MWNRLSINSLSSTQSEYSQRGIEGPLNKRDSWISQRPLLSPSPAGEGMSTTIPSGSRWNAMPPRGESSTSLLRKRSGGKNKKYGPTAQPSPPSPGVALMDTPLEGDFEDGLDPRNPAALGLDKTFSGDPEADDYLHNPDVDEWGAMDDRGNVFTVRGAANVGCLVILMIGIIALFAGYPIADFYTQGSLDSKGGYNLGGINATGQIPSIRGFASMIDEDTPSDVYTRTGYDGEEYTLVFSDEFNKDGRTFFPGDDPFFTAPDIHYWATGDFEWYEPSAATTRDGNLVLTMSQQSIHDLNFKSAMLQSWNQLCFQYSFYLEARISLPGNTKYGGFWPGLWLFGNLGRPGYGASTDGTWPYTYDSCDIGTLPNQTNAEGTGPEAALTSNNGQPISYLPGQRMSACTCPGEDHAGPDVSVGRGAPEIDVLEAQVDLHVGQGVLSQSFQVAPFDEGYQYKNTTDVAHQYDTDLTSFNTYTGGVYQEAVSSLTFVGTDIYQGTSREFGVQGVEMFTDPNDRSSGHITWVANGEKSWTMYPGAVGASESMQIGPRILPEEPMALVINFGMSNNFQAVDFVNLDFPAEYLIDYIRIYQRPEGRVGCDPDDHPTADYIEKHNEAYTNPNMTIWSDTGYAMPKNRLKDQC
ncbi:hypothetical protein V866_005865 [Kwoniella sp. B9012]|uniref:GH16 domain-containing protein n=1 Tax=Kwoniella europaea PYCC6329 TaxID=1423913 RepID=A0AAX4KQM3_9TREE